MINNEDQNNLFELIADYLKEDIACFAIGGTAMMFHGYKSATKDIDLVFHSEKDMSSFIAAIKELGYKERPISKIYSDKRSSGQNKPKMFTRGEERFDLFKENVFSLKMPKETKGKFDFIGKKTLTMFTPTPEWLIILKITTNRERDIDDILTICEKEKDISWDMIVDSIIKQATRWLLMDLEENLKKISKNIFIKKRYFDKIYAAYEILD